MHVGMGPIILKKSHRLLGGAVPVLYLDIYNRVQIYDIP